MSSNVLFAIEISVIFHFLLVLYCTRNGRNVFQCRDEVENLRETVTRRDESLRSLREEVERCSSGVSDAPYPNLNTSQSFSPSASSGLSSSQYSLASSSESHGSQGSRTSQDMFYLPESPAVLDNPEDSQRVR